MRQAVTISGLGTQRFNKGIENMELMFLRFYEMHHEDQLHPWESTVFGSYPAMDASARYFTPAYRRDGAASERFSEVMDPDGVLNGMIDDSFVHTSENNVHYLQMIPDPQGKAR
jgi:hypothetical protein